MARIQLGPFASRISGSVGEVEFRWTRDGQVAQSKTISDTWTTPAAMLTKNRFARAMRAYSHLDDYLRIPLARAAIAAHKAVSQQWVSSQKRLMQGEPWYYPDTHNSTFHLLVVDHYIAPTHVAVKLGPQLYPGAHVAAYGFIPHGLISLDDPWTATIPVDEEWHIIAMAPYPYHATVVFFPMPATPPNSVGHSASLYIPPP